jgi:serine/threonine protein kinase
LHSRNPCIIHRDIKPENLLIVGDTLKVADFGWSNIKDTKRVTYCGTPDYLAPEMIQELGHTEKLDIWTLGILMYELLAGKAPFTPAGGRDRRDKMQKLELNILNLKLEFPDKFPATARKLIMKI